MSEDSCSCLRFSPTGAHASSFVAPSSLNATSSVHTPNLLRSSTHARRPRALPKLSPCTYLRRITATVSQPRTSEPQSSYLTSAQTASFSHPGNSNGQDDLGDSSPRPHSTTAYDATTAAEESLTLLEWPAITERVLSHASTELGRSELVSVDNNNHLHIPSTRHESEQLLQQTREANILAARGGIDLLGAINAHPLAVIANKGRVLTGLEIHLIGKTLRVARQMRRQIVNIGPESLPLFHEIADPLSTAADTEREIVRCLDENGEINESAVPELAVTRQQIRDSASDARATLQQIMGSNSEAIQDRIITSRYDRFVVPVKTSHKNVDAFRSGIVHDASASGSTTYVEPSDVRPLNDQLRKLAAKERAIILKELTRLSHEIIAPIANQLQGICSFLALLDAANARAITGKSLNAVDVSFDDDKSGSEKSLYLPSVRHPLLMWAAADRYKANPDGNADEASVPKQEKPKVRLLQKKSPWHDAVVPSTYTLASSVRCVCVTGPNTGGKTLTLKTLGVVALMAKSGIFIPASPTATGSTFRKGTPLNDTGDITRNILKPREDLRVSIPFFDSVLADIGDDQSLVQSLSTFSGHVRRIKRILAASTPQSLVLLDEIGSGTDPTEGAALGMAVLRHLALGEPPRARLTFATTHHGELKTLKYSTDGSSHDEGVGAIFENASVEFDDVAMRPTYRLVWGIPGRSNALAIAERLGLNEDVIDGARELLSSSRGTSKNEDGGAAGVMKVDIEAMIQSLERDKRDAEQAKNDIEIELENVTAMRMEVESRLEKLKTSESELRNQQRQAINNEVENAKKQISQLIRDMQKGGGSAQAASRAAQRLRKLQSNISGNGEDIVEEDDAIEMNVEIHSAEDVDVGDRVVVKGLSEGEVEVVERASQNDLIVALGAMRTKVTVKKIIAIRRKKSINVPGAANGMLLQVENKKNKKGDNGNKTNTIIRTGANSIDVRGLRVDGAIGKIESAIDRALPLGSLWIIHGHGTGRLKAGIRKFLAENDDVQRFVDAEQSEGGAGVTIVYF